MFFFFLDASCSITLLGQCCFSHTFFWNRERSSEDLSLPTCPTLFLLSFKSPGNLCILCMVAKEYSTFPNLPKHKRSFLGFVVVVVLFFAFLPLKWLLSHYGSDLIHHRFICMSVFVLGKYILWWMEGGLGLCLHSYALFNIKWEGDNSANFEGLR